MLAVLLLCEMLVVVASKSTQSLEEDCFCPKIQKKLTEIEEKLLVVLGKAEEWMPYIPVVHELRQTVELQENAIRELKEKIQSPALPVPEALIMKPEVNEQEINLLKKVEMMENLTMEVQEELESERRVRRHLEEDLNETRYSIKTLGDRLQNVTLPVEAQTDYVELVVLSTLDTMNMTSLGDNLQKLYYKVDGVAYKNET
ncbi:uncharacterized protein LOC118180544, partial [Stegodyphus dumicola]|uniref:uncharacterized protein LOC118180544 n=1 Tax=Stegodyphus dumicola TaxID=202533 RepID=UPI0015AFC2A1